MADIGEEGFDEEVEEEKIGLVKRSAGLFLSKIFNPLGAWCRRRSVHG